MAHHRYQTEAIILGSVPRGESNRAFFLFTKDFGLVIASAQSARALSSKLRFGLTDLTRARVDLIRTEDLWRIVDAECADAPQAGLSSRALRAFAQSARLLRRLVHGERKEIALFDALAQYKDFLSRKNMPPETAAHAEIAFTIKMLHSLGYGARSEHTNAVAAMPFSEETCRVVAAHTSALLAFIRSGLRESHL